jgi:hypothetical protein
MIGRLVGLALAVAVVTPAVANLQLQPGCNNFNYSSMQIAGAIRSSRFATPILQFAACDFGAAALAESGGNTCASNGSNFGVLQLNNTNLPYGVTSDAYLALPMDKQVDVWGPCRSASQTPPTVTKPSPAIRRKARRSAARR